MNNEKTFKITRQGKHLWFLYAETSEGMANFGKMFFSVDEARAFAKQLFPERKEAGL